MTSRLLRAIAFTPGTWRSVATSSRCGSVVGAALKRAQRLAPHPDQSAAQHLHFGREPLRHDRGCGLEVAAGRGVVEQHAHDLGAGDAVNGGVMHLGQHRHRAVLQTLDDVELPQRAGAIQLAPDQVSHQVGQLPLVPGAGSAAS